MSITSTAFSPLIVIMAKCGLETMTEKLKEPELDLEKS